MSVSFSYFPSWTHQRASSTFFVAIVDKTRRIFETSKKPLKFMSAVEVNGLALGAMANSIIMFGLSVLIIGLGPLQRTTAALAAYIAVATDVYILWAMNGIGSFTALFQYNAGGMSVSRGNILGQSTALLILLAGSIWWTVLAIREARRFSKLFDKDCKGSSGHLRVGRNVYNSTS